MRLALRERWTPISQAEYLHQKRSIEGRHSRWWVALPRALWLTLSVFAVTFIFIVMLGGALGIFSLNYVPPEMALLAFIVWVLIPGFALFPTTLLMHFGLMMRTLLWTSNSIPREKVGGTWDLLLLTGIPAREIVVSKWRATVRRALPSYLRLALLRMAVVLWFIEWGRVSIEFYPTLEFSFRDYYQPPQFISLLLALALITLYTLVNAPVTAAVGMFAAFISKRAGINTFAAFVLRAVIFAAPILLLYLSFFFIVPYLNYSNTDYYNSFAYQAYTTLQMVAITLGDNGMIFAGATAAFNYNYWNVPRDLLVACAMLGCSLLYYLVVMLGMLRGARTLAFRQAALGQAKREKPKLPSTARVDPMQ